MIYTEIDLFMEKSDPKRQNPTLLTIVALGSRSVRSDLTV